MTFQHFLAILKRRRTAGCHGNLVISHVKLQINAEISSPMILKLILLFSSYKRLGSCDKFRLKGDGHLLGEGRLLSFVFNEL